MGECTQEWWYASSFLRMRAQATAVLLLYREAISRMS
eukprot:COSAG02_NODE_35_length_49339_cov_20.375102_2_plen_37_part_00